MKNKKTLTTQILAVTQKELRVYFNSPIAYIFVIALIALSFWIFFQSFFIIGQVEMRNYFSFLPWIFLFLIPALTMRIWAEEYKQGTIETLLTSSIPLPAIVIAKFKASALFLLFALILTFPLPFTLSLLGNLDWGAVIASYIGAYLLGCAFIALGLTVSAATNNQIVAFIIAVVVSFAFFILGDPIVTFAVPNFLVPVFSGLSLGTHFNSITRGVLDTKDIVYYLSFITFFLYLNYYALVSRK